MQQSTAARKSVLTPCFVEQNCRHVGEVEAAGDGLHRQADLLVRNKAVKHMLRQSPRFGAEYKYVVWTEHNLVVTTGRARRYGKQAPAGKVRETMRPVIVLGKRRQFMVVQSGALQAAVAKGKSYGVDEMQPGAGIGAKPHDVARICGNFGLVKNDIKHARF